MIISSHRINRRNRDISKAVETVTGYRHVRRVGQLYWEVTEVMPTVSELTELEKAII